MQKGIVAVVAILIVAAVAWFLLRPKPVRPPPPAPPEQPAPQKPADAPLPLAGESDAQVRKALAGVTLRPELQKWLAGNGDLLDRWAVIADNLAEDVSPRKQLAFLAPAKKFTVIERRGTIQLDLSSYQRYDLFAEVVASVDAKAFAAAVRELHPLLEAAYHKLGYPDRKLDEVAQKALRRLADAPVADGPVALVSSGALYKFKDPKLEAQGPVEKHLLRMGPRNTKLIQGKAREIMSALRP